MTTRRLFMSGAFTTAVRPPFWVEAGGIEPPSEDVQELAPTRLFRDLELAMHPRTDELMQGQPI